MTAKQDLRALVRALSAACAADQNVLKDGALVDALEARAKQILSARRGRRRASLAPAPPSLSPAPSKTAKKLKEIVRAGESKAAEGVAKRRKLSVDRPKAASGLESPIRCRSPFLFPTTERKQKHLAPDDFLLASVSRKLDPLTDSSVVRPVPVRAYHLAHPDATYGDVNGVHNAVGKAPSHGKEMRSVSPAPSGVDIPFKSLDRGAVDLSASMASTLASYYDDMGDDDGDRVRRYSRSPTMDSRAWSPMSDSIDWTPVEDEEAPRGGEAGPAETTISALELSSTEDEDYFSASEESAPSLVKNPTEVVMEVLYGIMKDNVNFKWLIDPVNQARVAKLVDYHLKEHGSLSGDHSDLIAELRAQVDQLARENCKIQSENAVLLESCQKVSIKAEQQGNRSEQCFSDMVEHHNKTLADMTRRLEQSESSLRVQQGLRREAEAAFQSELETKTGIVAALKQSLAEKEETVSALLKRTEDVTTAYAASSRGRAAVLSAGPNASTIVKDLRESVALREVEVMQLKTTLTDKDHEICNLHMQLSTKKKLLEEMSIQVAQHLERADGPPLDFDAFLFQSAVNKQQIINELTAALEVMEREVGGLEARVATKERESLQLKAKQGNLSRSLSAARREMDQMRAENERLTTALKSQKTRVRNLMATVDEKQEQIEHLNEQVDLRQAQLDQFISAMEMEAGPPSAVSAAIDTFASVFGEQAGSFDMNAEASNRRASGVSSGSSSLDVLAA